MNKTLGSISGRALPEVVVAALLAFAATGGAIFYILWKSKPAGVDQWGNLVLMVIMGGWVIFAGFVISVLVLSFHAFSAITSLCRRIGLVESTGKERMPKCPSCNSRKNVVRTPTGSLFCTHCQLEVPIPAKMCPVCLARTEERLDQWRDVVEVPYAIESGPGKMEAGRYEYEHERKYEACTRCSWREPF